MTELVSAYAVVSPATGNIKHYAAMDDGRIWATAETDDGVVVWHLVAPPLPSAAWRPHQEAAQ